MRNGANIFDLYRQVQLKESEILERTLTDAEKEKLKKLKEGPNNAPKNVTNALFVGSTAELQKMLKEK